MHTSPRTPLHPALARAAALLLCLITIAAGLLISLPRWSLTVDIGAAGPFILAGETAQVQNFFGYHEPEAAHDGSGRTFRWSSSHLAALTVPYALRKEPLQLDVVLCGCRAEETSTPVTLKLNNTAVATLDATDEWRRYHVAVPPTLTHPEYGLMVVVDAPLWTSPEGRQLGVAVDSMTIREMTPSPLAAPATVPVLLVGVVVLLWGRQWLLLPALLCAGWLLTNALYQPQLLPRWLLASVLVSGLLLLWGLLLREPATPENPRQQWLLAGVSSGVALWLVLSPQVLGSWIIDDAFISFRYARNLTEGHGLVFNAGERVEGYTNFLWTVVLAGGMAAGGDPLVVAAALTLILAFAIVALTLVLAWQLLAPGAGAPLLWAWGAPLLLVCSTPFLLYTTRGSGMETALFTTLILASLVALLRHAWLLAGILTALTMLTRPDGALLAGMAALYALAAGFGRGQPEETAQPRPQQRLLPLLHYSGAFLLLFVPYFAWRWSYYGYLLPNTFYVKVGGTSAQVAHGLGYLLAFGRDGVLLVAGGVALLAGMWAAWQQRRQQWREVALVAGLVLLFCAYIVAVGGDWIPGARFFVPVVPLLAVLTAWGMASMLQAVPRLQPLALATTAALLVALVLQLPQQSSFDYNAIWIQNYVVRRYREVGRWINANTPPDTWVATGVAGAIPYYAERPTIDALGLTDLHIAHLPSDTLGTGRPGHEKSDPDYVLGRKPEIITYKESHLFWGHPLLKANYRLRSFPGPEGQAVWLYVRKDVQL